MKTIDLYHVLRLIVESWHANVMLAATGLVSQGSTVMLLLFLSNRFVNLTPLFFMVMSSVCLPTNGERERGGGFSPTSTIRGWAELLSFLHHFPKGGRSVFFNGLTTPRH